MLPPTFAAPALALLLCAHACLAAIPRNAAHTRDLAQTADSTEEGTALTAHTHTVDAGLDTSSTLTHTDSTAAYNSNVIAHTASVLDPAAARDMLFSLPSDTLTQVLRLMDNRPLLNYLILEMNSNFSYHESAKLISAMPEFGEHYALLSRMYDELSSPNDDSKNNAGTVRTCIGQNNIAKGTTAFIQLCLVVGTDSPHARALFNEHILPHLSPDLQVRRSDSLRLSVYKLVLREQYRFIPHLMQAHPLPAGSIAALLEPFASVASVFSDYKPADINTIVYTNIGDLLAAVARRDDCNSHVKALNAMEFTGLALNLALLKPGMQASDFGPLVDSFTGDDPFCNIPYFKLIPQDLRLAAVTTFGVMWGNDPLNTADGFAHMFESDLPALLKATLEHYPVWFTRFLDAATVWAKEHASMAPWIAASFVIATPISVATFLQDKSLLNLLKPFVVDHTVTLNTRDEQIAFVAFLAQHWHKGSCYDIRNAVIELQNKFAKPNINEFYAEVAVQLLQSSEWLLQTHAIEPLNEALSKLQ